jgi:hypothetical protein
LLVWLPVACFLLEEKKEKRREKGRGRLDDLQERKGVRERKGEKGSEPVSIKPRFSQFPGRPRFEKRGLKKGL